MHSLAALVDELMKALLAGNVMTRTQLQEIEDAVSTRTGNTFTALPVRSRHASELIMLCMTIAKAPRVRRLFLSLPTPRALSAESRR